MKKRIFSIGILFVLFLSACASQSTGKTISGRVEIFTEEKSILTNEVTTNKTIAEDIIVESCQKQKIPYTLKENMFDNFGGIASTEENGWLLYVNGELANAGAAFIEMEDGFLLEFKYMNYDEAFKLE